jgi:PEP-CTERM motif
MKVKVLASAAIVAFSSHTIPAHADALAMADLAISNFLLGQVGSSGFVPITSVSINSEGRTGNATSLYNGVPGPGPVSVNVIGSGAADVPFQCSGACGLIAGAYGGVLENNFLTHISTAIADYALGDMVITGTAIGVGANALTRANAASAGGSNNGNANATILNGVTASTTFDVNSVLSDVAFFLNYDAFVKAFVSGDSSSGFASAATNWTLSVTKTQGSGAFIPLTWSPSELNQGFTADDLATSEEFLSTGGLFSPTRELTPGRYQLTIIQASNATIEEKVPEPGTLLLAGVALAALATVSRRRSSTL